MVEGAVSSLDFVLVSALKIFDNWNPYEQPEYYFFFSNIVGLSNISNK